MQSFRSRTYTGGAERSKCPTQFSRIVGPLLQSEPARAHASLQAAFTLVAVPVMVGRVMTTAFCCRRHMRSCQSLHTYQTVAPRRAERRCKRSSSKGLRQISMQSQSAPTMPGWVREDSVKGQVVDSKGNPADAERARWAQLSPDVLKVFCCTALHCTAQHMPTSFQAIYNWQQLQMTPLHQQRVGMP